MTQISKKIALFIIIFYNRKSYERGLNMSSYFFDKSDMHYKFDKSDIYHSFDYYLSNGKKQNTLSFMVLERAAVCIAALELGIPLPNDDVKFLEHITEESRSYIRECLYTCETELLVTLIFPNVNKYFPEDADIHLLEERKNQFLEIVLSNQKSEMEDYGSYAKRMK